MSTDFPVWLLEKQKDDREKKIRMYDRTSVGARSREQVKNTVWATYVQQQQQDCSAFSAEFIWQTFWSAHRILVNKYTTICYALEVFSIILQRLCNDNKLLHVHESRERERKRCREEKNESNTDSLTRLHRAYFFPLKSAKAFFYLLLIALHCHATMMMVIVWSDFFFASPWFNYNSEIISFHIFIIYFKVGCSSRNTDVGANFLIHTHTHTYTNEMQQR